MGMCIGVKQCYLPVTERLQCECIWMQVKAEVSGIVNKQRISGC